MTGSGEDRADDWQGWVGFRRELHDLVTERMVAEFRVVLTGAQGPGAVPPGFHWCLCPDIAPPAELGRDGHPAPGRFLPKLPLPRRMWAGGEIRFGRPFAVGDRVSRTSTIADVTFKEGRSGRLGFVAVDHDYRVDGEVVLSERQNLVYREDPKSGEAPPPERAPDWAPLATFHASPDATLLFRYSAITFNGHRIHYDHPYATAVEGYDGLVVHGPLQAIYMQNLAASILGDLPATFRYRGLAPLTVGHPITVEAREDEEGLALRVRRDGDGVVTMAASATAR